MKKPTEYFLQINQPGALLNDKEYMAVLESTTPFMSFSKGDLIHNRGFENLDLIPKGKLLRVTSVEHIIQDLTDNLIHYVYVNTELVDDTDEIRES